MQEKMALAIEAGKTTPNWRDEFPPNVVRQIENKDAYAYPRIGMAGRPLYEVWRKRTSKRKGNIRNNGERALLASIGRKRYVRRAERSKRRYA